MRAQLVRDRGLSSVEVELLWGGIRRDSFVFIVFVMFQRYLFKNKDT